MSAGPEGLLGFEDVPALRFDAAGALLEATPAASRLLGGGAVPDLAAALRPVGRPLAQALAASGLARLDVEVAPPGRPPFPATLVLLPAGADRVALVVAAPDTEREQALDLQLEAATFELERALLELADAHERLQALDQAKTRFFANVNHELRTPMSSIIGFAEDALDGIAGPLTPELRTSFEAILAGGRRQLALVSALLDFTRLKAGKVELECRPMALEEVFRDLRTTMAPLVARKAQALVIPDHADAATVLADPDKVYQILLNLLSNAHKFTPEGGRIAVSAVVEGEFMRIAVEDTGVGVPEADLPLLFEEFHQVRRRGGPRVPGTGLGLAITRELVEHHGGTIAVANRVEGGTTFSFTLPLTTPECGTVEP